LLIALALIVRPKLCKELFSQVHNRSCV